MIWSSNSPVLLYPQSKLRRPRDCVGCSYWGKGFWRDLKDRFDTVPRFFIQFIILKNELIKNPSIIFIDDCPENLIEPIKDYWELNDNLEFVNKSINITQKHDVTSSMTQTLYRFSRFKFEAFCNSCEILKTKIANSKTQFLATARKIKANSHECNECKSERMIKEENEAIEREIKKKEQQEQERKELVNKLDKAIENKNWRKLSSFEFEVLKNCLQFDDFGYLKQFYWKKNKTPSGFKALFIALKAIADLDLIVIQQQFDRFKGYNVIHNYQYIKRLSEEFEYDFKQEKEKTENKKQNPTDCDTIKLRLTLNEFNNHPDSPKYAGTIKFTERIIIEPNVNYTFAQWKRSYDELYFTLVPNHVIENLPQQKKISQLPKSLQECISDFLNAMGGNDL